MSKANVIAVEELRLGMFVQLEGGWLSHPFSLSAFKLSSAEQINTLRRLGLAQVRWVPEKSDTPAAAAPPPLEVTALPAAEHHETMPSDTRARDLQLQRESARRCDEQRSKAESELRELLVAAKTRPQEAGRASAALTQSMLDNMLHEDEVGIRLVATSSDRELAHALNVSVISMLIGRTLGLTGADLLDIGVGALLHDAGKQQLPPRHRQLVDGQSTADVLAYREHVNQGLQLGHSMCLSVGAMAVLAQHHELANGAGFPKRLAGDQINLAARVVAIVNRYDGLCNPGQGAVALTPHEAVAMLFAQHRQSFDNTVLNAFIRMMGVYPAGSIVQLTDDRYALVVGANSSRPLKPRVLVFDPKVSSADALLLDLEHERDLGIRRSLAPHRLPTEALNYLAPQPRVCYYFEPLVPKDELVTTVS